MCLPSYYKGTALLVSLLHPSFELREDIALESGADYKQVIVPLKPVQRQSSRNRYMHNSCESSKVMSDIVISIKD
jgi:hypothetical protein